MDSGVLTCFLGQRYFEVFAWGARMQEKKSRLDLLIPGI